MLLIIIVFGKLTYIEPPKNLISEKIATFEDYYNINLIV